MPNAQGKEADSWKAVQIPPKQFYHPFSDLSAESWQVDFIFLAEVLTDLWFKSQSLGVDTYTACANFSMVGTLLCLNNIHESLNLSISFIYPIIYDHTSMPFSLIKFTKEGKWTEKSGMLRKASPVSRHCVLLDSWPLHQLTYPTASLYSCFICPSIPTHM